MSGRLEPTDFGLIFWRGLYSVRRQKQISVARKTWQESHLRNSTSLRISDVCQLSKKQWHMQNTRKLGEWFLERDRNHSSLFVQTHENTTTLVSSYRSARDFESKFSRWGLSLVRFFLSDCMWWYGFCIRAYPSGCIAAERRCLVGGDDTVWYCERDDCKWRLDCDDNIDCFACRWQCSCDLNVICCWQCSCVWMIWSGFRSFTKRTLVATGGCTHCGCWPMLKDC